MAGLLGSGRTETARLLFGADRADSGTVTVEGEPVRLRNPRVALAKGIAYASENRRTEGLVGNLSVRANIVLAMQSARGWARAIPRRQQVELADKYIKALDIRPTDPEAIVANLSGGNQQKVLLARWLLTAPKLLLLDEPTRGIDVGAKAEIQRLVAALADDGLSVLFISAELEEVLRLSHRIVVMRDLHKVAELENRGTTESDLMQHHRRGSRDRGGCGGGAVKAIVTHRLFWPLLILVALLVATRLKSPIFFDIRVVNGNLFGQPDHDPPADGADPARRPGDDPRHLDPRHRPVGRRRGGDRRRRRRRRSSTRPPQPDAVVTVLVGVGIGLLLAAARRGVERVPRHRRRDPADHRHARADDRRPRRRPADHRRADHHGELAALRDDRRRLLARPAVLDHPRRRRSSCSPPC